MISRTLDMADVIVVQSEGLRAFTQGITRTPVKAEEKYSLDRVMHEIGELYQELASAQH